jgi:hypothetical protein
MRFKYLRDDALPKLSWCARITRGDDDVVVRHGPWVETTAGAFFEGAWNGTFADWRPSEATACFGSGAELSPNGIRFVTPTHMLERIHLIQLEGSVVVSNSIPFALAETNEVLDTGYKHYHFDLMTNMRGYRRYLPGIRLASGRELRVFFHCNVLVDQQLSISTEDKRLPPSFASYDQYIGFLRETVRLVDANARDAGRRHPYQPLATISSGYDSPAVALFAREIGCDEAFTFGTARPGYDEEDDSGRDIAAVFGLQVREFDRLAYKSLDAFPEAEFLAYGAGGEEVVFAPVAELLAGRVLFTGYLGDTVWSRTPSRVNTELLMAYPGGSSLGEFRIRVGFVHFPLPTVGYIRHPSICAISQSSELAPWALGTDYDRPIPRRLVEQAGVPRTAFGRAKKAVTQPLWLTESLDEVFSTPSYRDFAAFIADVPMFGGLGERVGFRIMRLLYETNLRINWRLQSLGKRLGFTVSERPLVSERFGRDRGPSTLTFHWGVSRVIDRYRANARSAAQPQSPSRSGT